MADVVIKRGLQADYNALETKDANTIYYTTDAKNIYIGEDCYTDKIVFDKPESGVKGYLYVKDGTFAWDGSKYVAIGADISSITGDVNKLKSDMTTAKADIDAVEADMTTAKADITKAKSDIAANTTEIGKKANKSTTLSGYGITDAYTKAQTSSEISKAVANAAHLKRQIVDALPEVADADENTIYMVKKSGGSGNQQYDEYMLVSVQAEGAETPTKSFEKIGDSTVNLNGYATQSWVTAQINPVSDKANANASAIATINGTGDGSITKAKNDAVNTAKAYADGLAKNYATAAQGAKADSALQAADVAEGKANGTIAVKGTDVKVHGLGSAAYAATTAFDAAGAATKALNDAKAYANGLKLQWGTI